MSRPKPGSLASRLRGADARSVLVVEDEPDIATFLSAYFRASGTEVVHIDPASPAQAVEEAAACSPACALIDLNLRGTTGFDVLIALHEDERTASIPVLIVTADARPATQERAAALGAVGFVPKPFNVKDLHAAVQGIIAGTTGGVRDASASSAESHLVSADDVLAQLDAAVDAQTKAHGSTSFALIRFVGAAASPAVVGEVVRRFAPRLVDAEFLGATAADELAVLFPRVGPDDAVTTLELMIGGGKIDIGLGPGRTVTLVVHIGLAAYPEHAGTGEELYMATDVALAEAIERGASIVTSR